MIYSVKTDIKLYFIILCLSTTISCDSSDAVQVWHKGNLHTHSLWSDGDDFPEMIIDGYKNNDYQFIAISDHNTLADTQYWYGLTEKDIQNRTLDKYLQSFGEDWVETKVDSSVTSVRLKTFDEYRSKLEEKGTFLIIRSEEVTSSFEKNPIHINVTNIQKKIDPVKGTSVVDVMQKTLDLVKAQRKKLGIPMFAHINHPNFGYGVSTNDLKKLNGERFFEVYNGHPQVNNEGNDMFDSTEIMWDLINIHYYQQGKPLLLGIATDDSHNYHDFSEKNSNTGRGWVMVDSKELNTASLINAMEKGDFYASTGVYLKSIKKTSRELTIEIDAENGVNYELIFLGYKEGSEMVKELKRVNGAKANYVFQEEDIFVRVKVISNEPKDSPDGTNELKQAWVQPILIKG
jgi:hypothetical protein